MNAIVASIVALFYGVGSSVIPVLNAEAFAIASANSSVAILAGSVALLATGQSLGKLGLFTAMRFGLDRSKTLNRAARSKHAARVVALMDSPARTATTVLAAATVGVPPLAVVSVAAGATRQSGTAFFLICLSGRLVRFIVVAAPFAVAFN